jgi:hypothetical protein
MWCRPLIKFVRWLLHGGYGSQDRAVHSTITFNTSIVLCLNDDDGDDDDDDDDDGNDELPPGPSPAPVDPREGERQHRPREHAEELPTNTAVMTPSERGG